MIPRTRAWAVLALSAAAPVQAGPPTDGWLGVVLPGRSVDVVAELDGTATGVHVGLGSTVAAGDTLAVVQAPAVHAELAGAEARVLAAEAEVQARDARVHELQRMLAQRTETSELFTRDEIEARLSELRIAEADRSLAQARAEEARVRCAEIGRRLAGAVVRAPLRGEIARIEIASGEQVGERQRVFRVVNTDRVRIRFAVPEGEPRRPEEGDTLRVTYEEAEAAAVVTARAPLLETEAGCLVFEAAPLACRHTGGAGGERAFPAPAGAVVRVTRGGPAAPPGHAP